MSIIEGASVSVKTMSDGTLRLSIDIEPRNAQAAFALFGAPGRAVALAALKDGAGAVREADAVVAAALKPKGAEWAKLAGMWCEDKDFQQFLRENGYVCRNDIEAAEALRRVCRIESRVELDHDPRALQEFNSCFRHPFMKYMQARGISK
jgi:hypothetical protein